MLLNFNGLSNQVRPSVHDLPNLEAVREIGLSEK